MLVVSYTEFSKQYELQLHAQPIDWSAQMKIPQHDSICQKLIKKKKKKERRLCLTKYESSLHVISLLTLRTYHHVDNRELSCVICLILPDQHRTHPLTFLVKFLPRILITMVNFTGSPQMTMQNRWWTRRLWSINITRTEKTTWILKVRFMNQNIKGCLIGRTYNNCFLLHTPMITTTTKQKGGNNK